MPLLSSPLQHYARPGSGPKCRLFVLCSSATFVELMGTLVLLEHTGANLCPLFKNSDDDIMILSCMQLHNLCCLLSKLHFEAHPITLGLFGHSSHMFCQIVEPNSDLSSQNASCLWSSAGDALPLSSYL